MKTATLYIVTNTVNDKVYVGQTAQSFARRWSRHRWDAKQGSPCRFHAALRCYGAEAFEARVLVIGPAGDWMKDLEVRAIALYDSFNKGYNDTKGGDGGRGSTHRLGKKHTPEARAKISAGHLGIRTRLGHKNTPEHNEKVRQANLGKKLSAEHRANIGTACAGKTAWNKGVSPSSETRRKMSEQQKLCWVKRKEKTQ